MFINDIWPQSRKQEPRKMWQQEKLKKTAVRQKLQPGDLEPEKLGPKNDMKKMTSEKMRNWFLQKVE